jgi:hypothetical protein
MLLISVVHMDLRISPQIVDKIRNDPHIISGTWGKKFLKKSAAKYLVTLSIYAAGATVSCFVLVLYLLFVKFRQSSIIDVRFKLLHFVGGEF